ncbi:hypothetical protein K1T71_004834 [Dendrolimus kikuchii]|uniref:Uncharacterized protein n=1 Tax=Dendrolimus kikuchii TaxID=765133 RepID=A0ACC1D6V8_9NEOP|nr:hypothetical protein K1T71_004834 [Dendrolimus kikuchii]
MIFAVPRIDPLVDTNTGLIRGLVSDNGQYAMFLGIPYGVVDKENPFGVSTPHPGFEEAFEAYDDSALCPQIDTISGRSKGSIDCLHLNVFVPSTANSRNRLPVLVWIHGGGFNGGAKSVDNYGPSYFIKQEIILVTVNYRVGPYGFMCLDIPEVPGNQGLKDQLLALKWVKENIAAFGGDTNKITISGGSAGSMSTNFHVLYAKENLFNKAIMQSGTALSPVMYEPLKDLPLILAANLGLNTSDIYEAVAFLSVADPSLVVGVYNELGLIQRVCIEKEFEETEGYILEDWLSLSTNFRIKNMPILIGFNEEEKSKSDSSQNPEYYQNLKIVETYISNAFSFDKDDSDEMIDIVRHFYFGDDGESEETAQQIIDFDSDFIFNHPTYRAIDQLIDNAAGNIYFYLFSYTGDKISDQDTDENRKASHGDETLYLFDSSSNDVVSTDDQLVIDRMTTLWANFIKYGDPTPETTDLLPVKWSPITKGSARHYLNIGKELSAGMRPLYERMSFWDLFYKINGHLAVAYAGLD